MKLSYISVCLLLAATSKNVLTLQEHVCVIEVERTLTDDERPKNYFGLTVLLNITSVPFSTSLVLYKTNIYVPATIPVYTFQNDTRQRNDIDTHDLHHYKGDKNNCRVILKVCLHERSNETIIGIEIYCSDRNYEVTYQEYRNHVTKKVYIKTHLKEYNITAKELQSYRLDSVVLPRHLSGKTDTTKDKVSAKKIKRNAPIIHTKYVEMIFVLSHDLFSSFNHNFQHSTAVLIDIADAIDTIYRVNNIRITLVGIEIWNEHDKIEMSTSANSILKDFSAYAAKQFKTADNAHLLTSTVFGNDLIGLAYVGSMCSNDHSAGITNFKLSRHLSMTVATVAHELGHNFHMKHDDEEVAKCYCEEKKGLCLMNSKEIQPVPRYFSTCSQTTLNNFFQTQESACLNNIPLSQYRETSTCGNNKVDLGEECDCGPASFCTNQCCDAQTCKLSINSECAHGDCCRGCQILANRTSCRSSGDNVCDVMDYCNGIDSACVNSYVANGTPCDIDGICYDGDCKSRNTQCRKLWGSGSNDANENCYKKLNTYGEAYGHCGIQNEDNGEYIPCEAENVKCGSLHCMNVTEIYPIIGFQSRYSKIKLNFDGVQQTCHGGYADLGKNQPNPGEVYEFTPCGIDKYCINKQCLFRNIVPLCDHDCRPNGMCTNLGVCQCNVGWQGSNCSEEMEYGYVVPTVPLKRNVYYYNSGMRKLNFEACVYSLVVTNIAFLIKLL